MCHSARREHEDAGSPDLINGCLITFNQSRGESYNQASPLFYLFVRDWIIEIRVETLYGAIKQSGKRTFIIYYIFSIIKAVYPKGSALKFP